MFWADYCISKLSFDRNRRVETVVCCRDLGESLSADDEHSRTWLVTQFSLGKTFCFIYATKDGKWKFKSNLFFNGSKFSISTDIVPRNLFKRKLFVSYYHNDDQLYKRYFDNLFGDLITQKSVGAGEISSDNSDDYTRKLIQQGYLSDTTVLVVLIGAQTLHRKHVDWEIWGALDRRIGDKRAGLLGLKIPEHPDYGTGHHHYNLLPARLYDNLKSGYAIIRDWTDDRVVMQGYIEKAFSSRESHQDLIDNSRLQMSRNTNK